MACEGLACDVERAGLEGGPLFVEVEEEVEEVVGGLAGGVNEGFGGVVGVGEADAEGLVDEDGVSDYVPGVAVLFYFGFGYADGSVLGEGSELGAGAGSALEPEDEGHAGVGDGGSVGHGREHGVVHLGFAGGVVPVYFFVACFREGVPE